MSAIKLPKNATDETKYHYFFRWLNDNHWIKGGWITHPADLYLSELKNKDGEN